MKYLARYLTGGPISDARLSTYKDGKLTLTARTGKTHGGSDEIETVTLPVVEFVRRWCLHILPSGFTKNGCYGGWSNHHSQRYVAECRQLLQGDEADISVRDSGAVAIVDADLPAETSDVEARPCPECGGNLELFEQGQRYSWRDIFRSYGKYRTEWYRSWESSG